MVDPVMSVNALGALLFIAVVTSPLQLLLTISANLHENLHANRHASQQENLQENLHVSPHASHQENPLVNLPEKLPANRHANLLVNTLGKQPTMLSRVTQVLAEAVVVVATPALINPSTM